MSLSPPDDGRKAPRSLRGPPPGRGAESACGLKKNPSDQDVHGVSGFTEKPCNPFCRRVGLWRDVKRHDTARVDGVILAPSHCGEVASPIPSATRVSTRLCRDYNMVGAEAVRSPDGTCPACSWMGMTRTRSHGMRVGESLFGCSCFRRTTGGWHDACASSAQSATRKTRRRRRSGCR